MAHSRCCGGSEPGGHVAFVRQMYEVFGRGDIEGALSFVSPDVEASPASALLSGVPGHYSGTRDCVAGGARVR